MDETEFNKYRVTAVTTHEIVVTAEDHECAKEIVQQYIDMGYDLRDKSIYSSEIVDSVKVEEANV